MEDLRTSKMAPPETAPTETLTMEQKQDQILSDIADLRVNSATWSKYSGRLENVEKDSTLIQGRLITAETALKEAQGKITSLEAAAETTHTDLREARQELFILRDQRVTQCETQISELLSDFDDWKLERKSEKASIQAMIENRVEEHLSRQAKKKHLIFDNVPEGYSQNVNQ